MSDALLYGLLGYIVIREALFIYTSHKLINKLMSRNYHEYQISKKADKIEPEKPAKVDEDLPEDILVFG